MNNSNYDDAELIDRYKKGDLKAFEFLYHKYKEVLYLIFRSKGIPPDDAMDCCHDIFHILIKRLRVVELKFTFQAFLNKIVKNKIVDYYREKAISKFIITYRRLEEKVKIKNDEDFNSFIEKIQTDHVNQFDELDLLDAINHCLGRINNVKHRIILLLWLQDFKRVEICEMLDLPIGSVGSCLSRYCPVLVDCIKSQIY